MSRIHLSAPDTGALEEEYVLDALRSGWVAPLGPHVDSFEREVADRVDVTHAVALSSGTAALHLALVAWGVKPHHTVITSTLTFAATANAICYTGAQPFFIDCDSDTGNMDPALLEKALDLLSQDGRIVPVVIPVDLLGKCADYEAILDVTGRRGVRVLSDAAESFGASDANQKAAGSFGDAGILSFNGNKIMTTSGGGMLLTSDDALAARVRHLSTQAREPVPYYEHKEVGYNYRLSNLLAAVGRAQLLRFDEMLMRRREIRDHYSKVFADVPGVTILGRADANDNCWLTAIIVDPQEAGWTTMQLAEVLARADIETRPLWKPMHMQPVFRDRPSLVDGRAERLYRLGLTLPSGSSMSSNDVSRVMSTITDWLPK